MTELNCNLTVGPENQELSFIKCGGLLMMTKVLYFVLRKYLSWIQFRGFAVYNSAISCVFSLVPLFYFAFLSKYYLLKEKNF